MPEESEEPDEERLSFLIINEAAKVYGIHKYKTPSGKIEAVSTAYNNALLSVIHTRLQKQGKEEVIHTDQKIQDAMNAVSLDTKRQLQSALMSKGIQRTVHRTYFKTGTFHKVPFRIR